MLLKAICLFLVLGFLVASWMPPAPYPGRAGHATWRAEAIERINEHRKSALSIRVVDSFGRPLSGARVHVTQQSHAFRFGTAVDSRRLLGEGPEDGMYRKRLVELFNTATIRNGLKWRFWEPGNAAGFVQRETIAAIEWLRKAGLDVRGHVLVWPGERHVPRDVAETARSATASDHEQDYVRNRIAGHIESVTSATANMLYAWDVVNEPREHHLLMEFLPEGPEALADWFQLAARKAPETKLFLNEFGILTGGRVNTPNQDLLERHLRMLRDAGAPIDGIGLQAHFDGVGGQAYFTGPGSLTPPEMVWRVIDRYAQLVDEVHVTEFDFVTEDERLQADYTRDFLTAAFAHPAVQGITLWGFWEALHWRPLAALYRSDWTVKPNGQVFKNLVYGDWWSDEVLETDERGSATTRVFHGNHAVVADAAGRRAAATVAVGKEPAEVTITLP